jgi:hypothetical protein
MLAERIEAIQYHRRQRSRRLRRLLYPGWDAPLLLADDDQLRELECGWLWLLCGCGVECGNCNNGK